MGADVRRVLIADGDATLRQQVFSALLDNGIFSDCVSTTKDALTKLTEERYGVLVLDVALPYGEADQVVAAVRDMPGPSRPVVLVLAANPEAAKTLDVDIVQIVLRRPVKLRQLVELIRSCLLTAATRHATDASTKEKGNGDQASS